MEEERLQTYRQRIRQIDRILIPAIESLVELAEQPVPASDPLTDLAARADTVYFPPWVSEVAEAPVKHYLVTRSFCAAILLRIARDRRRFRELDETTRDGLRRLQRSRARETFLPSRPTFEEWAGLLHSDTYGALNPMTASHLFGVLIETGERNVHGGLGCLAFFSMVWSMLRQFPRGVAGDGAQLEPWGPTSYVTAKCLLPVETIRRVCRRRAQLFDEIVQALGSLEEQLQQADAPPNPYSQWRFASTLDRLSGLVWATSRVSSAPAALERCAEALSRLADSIDHTTEDALERRATLVEELLALLDQARSPGDSEATRRRLGESLLSLAQLSSEPRALAEYGRTITDLADSVGRPTREWLYDRVAAELESSSPESLESLHAKATREFERALRAVARASQEATAEAGQALDGIRKELLAKLEAMEKVRWQLIPRLRKASLRRTTYRYSEAIVSQLGQWSLQPDSQRELAAAVGALRAALAGNPGRLDGSGRQARDEAASKLAEVAARESEQLSIDSRGVNRVKFPAEWRDDPEYWKDLIRAAKEALEVCDEGRAVLASVSPRFKEVAAGLSTVVAANEAMVVFFTRRFDRHARWCRMVVDREIASISAENLTAFNPAELVSAIAVAVRWGHTRSPLAVADAVGKALDGARGDGSWLPGQPYYCEGRLLSAVPVSSDTMGTLAAAMTDHREIEVADIAFDRYVDWLDRTRSEMSVVVGNGAGGKPLKVSGWASDRTPGPRRVDLWATAHSINALLEIRDLIEYRLWQMCERTFTVLSPTRGLGEIAPLDLDRPHAERLLCRLKRGARIVQGDEFVGGRYSFVLHGPPGSSKSSIAEAFACDVWSSPITAREAKPQVVRITPADFTRLGESRLDSVARFVFELLGSVRGVTVFFDEIDDLLHKRDPTGQPEFLKLVVPAMLNRLQDLREACERQQICVVLATNYVEQIEPALLRKGRIDDCFPVVYPDRRSREAMVWRELLQPGRTISPAFGKPRGDRRAFARTVAGRTHGRPWKTLHELCGELCAIFACDPDAALEGLEERIRSGDPAVPDPGYAARCGRGPVSCQLCNEVCAHFQVLATGDCLEVCGELAAVLPCPQGKRPWGPGGYQLPTVPARLWPVRLGVPPVTPAGRI